MPLSTRSDGDDLTQVDQEQLVLAALLGDLVSFDELVRRFRKAVMAVAQTILGCHNSAEDVTQEVFLVAFKSLSQLEDASCFGAWLYAITRRRARTVAQQDGRSEHYEPSNLDCFLLERSAELIKPQVAAQPLETLVHREELANITLALSQLPEAYQFILRLRYYEEWPVNRIADFLSLPITTVKWRLHHGRHLLRRRVETSSMETSSAEPIPGGRSKWKNTT
jgi:RNA polymerase sigma-70 factor (ECF subfamily)